MTDHAVLTRDLERRFDGDGESVAALTGLDLEVAPGEFTAVMGPSGCGKSTLLHLVAGLDRPTSGEVWVHGRRIDTLSETDRAVVRREAVGLVFQAFNLVPNLTVQANIELPGLLARRSRDEVKVRAMELLDSLGIADRGDAFPAELSGGQQQRVAIARALVNTPTVLLADEPTGNLDSESGEAVLALLDEFHRAGQTIVMATHDPKVAAAADRVVFMRDGRVVEETKLTIEDGAQTVLTRFVELDG